MTTKRDSDGCGRCGKSDRIMFPMLAKCAEPKAPTDVYFCTACYEGWRAFQNETISIDLCKIDENGDVKLDWRTKNFYRVRMVYFLASYAPEAA